MFYVGPQTSTPCKAVKPSTDMIIFQTESPITSGKEAGQNESAEMDIDCTFSSSSFHGR